MLTTFRLDDKERNELRIIGDGDMTRGLRIALWYLKSIVTIKKAYRKAVTKGFLND